MTIRIRISFAVIIALTTLGAAVIRHRLEVAARRTPAATSTVCYDVNRPLGNQLGALIADGHHAVFTSGRWVVDGVTAGYAPNPTYPVNLCVRTRT